MNTLFIEAKYIGSLKISSELIKKLPKKIGIATTVQFSDRIDEIKGQLKGKEVFAPKGKQKYPAQILGCDVSAAENIKDKVDAFLYIGSGRFHPLWIAVKTGKKAYCFNPITGGSSEIQKEDVEEYNKKRKGKLLKFLSSKTVGILVSTKPGQSNFRKAIWLKENLKGKECYIFAFDTLSIGELENFSFIECWVNTACPRIEGKGIVNLDDVENQNIFIETG